MTILTLRYRNVRYTFPEGLEFFISQQGVWEVSIPVLNARFFCYRKTEIIPLLKERIHTLYTLYQNSPESPLFPIVSLWGSERQTQPPYTRPHRSSQKDSPLA